MQKTGTVIRMGDLVCSRFTLTTFAWDDEDAERDWDVNEGEIGLVIGLERSDALVLFNRVKLWMKRTDLKVLRRC